MTAGIKQILQGIEQLRNILESTISDRGIDDPEVEILSKRLDETLNQYYKLIEEKSEQ